MKKLIQCCVVAMFLFSMVSSASSGDSYCEGYTSQGNPFSCGDLGHGNCTWWVASKRLDMWGKFGGNAKYWYDNAAGAGFDVGSVPKVDAIAVFSNDSYGHVAYIESVNSGGSFYVSEMDYFGSLGTKDGLQHATYYPYSGNRYTREDVVTGFGTAGTWTLTGFVYRRPLGYNSTCAQLNSRYAICWIPSNTDVSCQDGSDWVLYDSDTASMIRTSTNDYCPDYSSSVGGGSESSGSPPVIGGTNSGNLPNLIPNNSDIENASRVKVTTLHINESGFCKMQTKNIGNEDAEEFQSRCFISDGYKIDNNPRDEGKEDTQGLDEGDTHTEHEDFVAPEFPGTYNAVWCTDSANQVTESNEGDNCHAEDVFTVWSNPNVLATSVSIVGGKTILLPGESYSVDAAILNAGENFGRTILVGYYLDGVLIGTDHIKRENLKGGVNKVENLSVAIAPSVSGMHTLQACADFDNRIAETNEGDNCKSMTFEVQNPAPPPLPPPPPQPTPPPTPITQEEDDAMFLQMLLE